jgi:hypothetical protein
LCSTAREHAKSALTPVALPSSAREGCPHYLRTRVVEKILRHRDDRRFTGGNGTAMVSQMFARKHKPTQAKHPLRGGWIMLLRPH